jgi:hypothetical protein
MASVGFLRDLNAQRDMGATEERDDREGAREEQKPEHHRPARHIISHRKA